MLICSPFWACCRRDSSLPFPWRFSLLSASSTYFCSLHTLLTLSCRVSKQQLLLWLNTFPQGDPLLLWSSCKVLMSWDPSRFCCSFTLSCFMPPGRQHKAWGRPLQSCSQSWPQTRLQAEKFPAALRIQPHSNLKDPLCHPSAELT